MNGERLLLVTGRGDSADLRLKIKTLAQERGLSVLIDTAEIFCVGDQGKVQIGTGSFSALVMGDIFHRPAFAPIHAPMTEKELAAAARSFGGSLVTRSWGSYVGLFHGPPGEPISLLRAPFGRIPLFYSAVGQGLVAASCADLLVDALPRPPSIDWAAVGLHLLAGQLRSAATCIEDVRELLPGFRLTVGDADPELVWDPSAYCPPAAVRAPAEISEQLRELTDACVGAWSKSYDRVVLGVSGGLDSSVVAASAMAAGAEVWCLTLVTNDPAGDERIYARDLTEFLGVELHEFPEDPLEIDLHASAAAHLPRPTARSFAQSGDRRNLELARRNGATAFFSGAGGDNLFCYLQSVAPLIDAFLSFGPGRRSWQTARDLSSLTGASLWEVLRRGLRRARRRGPNEWRIDRTFLSDRQSTAGSIDHPWLQACAQLPPGKQDHVGLLMNIQNHLDGFGRERSLPVIAPLLSQPLVEFCLGVPTWCWLEGGRNRAPVRRAFKDALPTSVLDRRSKGTPDPFNIEIFESHRKVVSEMLLEGLLAQQGLLDRAAIEGVITYRGPAQGHTYSRLLSLVDVEAWLRCWRARG